MREDVFVYLSGPITARHGRSVEENTASAVKVYLTLLGLGIPCFAPQLSAAFPSAFSEVSYDTWLAYDFAVIRRCTHLWRLARWETSPGALREIAFAESLGLPIIDRVGDLERRHLERRAGNGGERDGV